MVKNLIFEKDDDIMAGTVTHLAIADKIYSILGSNIIKNVPLFFGGNIAPDAIHAKIDFQRADKKRSHLCEGIRSYGYGYPEMATLFQKRIDDFIDHYCLTAIEDKDLYLGYLVHLLVDEIYLLEIYSLLEEHLRDSGIDTSEPEFHKNLADAVNNHEYRIFFADTGKYYDMSSHEYKFEQDVEKVLEAKWDYEIKDLVSSYEINASKRWVIDTFFKSKPLQDGIISPDREKAIKFIDITSKRIVDILSCKKGVIYQ